LIAVGTVNDIMDSDSNFIDTIKDLNLRKEKDNGKEKFKRVRVFNSILKLENSPKLIKQEA